MAISKNELVVATYRGPDTDGFACAIAYAEYLTITGQPAVVKISGKLHPETLFVLKTLHNNFHNVSIRDFGKRHIVLVDASDTKGLDRSIKPQQVIGIIDHRMHHEAEKFPKAYVQIEFVGAAATLIAEKFHALKLPISRRSACLLYAAIFSNTLNLKAKVTTARDRGMARWLQTQAKIPSNLIMGMFRAKSRLAGSNLSKQIRHDLAWFEIGNQRIGIAQLELVNTLQVESRLSEVKRILARLSKKHNLTHVFLSMINLVKGHNTFICFDREYQAVLEKTLQVRFIGQVAHRSGLIMRKEIVPKLVARAADESKNAG